MEHTSPDIVQALLPLVIVVGAALLAGLTLNALRQPAIVGFILAGVLLGPSAAGLVERTDAIATLAELGVLMLLFIVGMELRIASFRARLGLSIGVVAVQITVAVALALIVELALAGSWREGIVLGFIIAITSTAVTMKMMQDVRETGTETGRSTIAILVAQDLAVIPLLLLTQALGPGEIDIAGAALKIVVSIVLLVGFVILLARVSSFRLPFTQSFLNDADMGTLAVLTLCFGAASLSGLFGLSPALGAFLAGLALGQSTLRRYAIRAAQPVQSILMFVFFLSVGLLIDLDFIWRELWLVLALLGVVIVGKTLVNAAILRAFGQSWPAAFQGALFLAPIGEFSFVLAATAADAGVFGEEGYRLAIAIIALSLLASPLWYESARRVHDLARRRIDTLRALMRETYPDEISAARAAARAVRGGTAAITRRLKREPKPPD